MTPNERTLGRAAAALYALVIAASMVGDGDVVAYLPHVAILAVCCVAVPAMLRRRVAPRGL